MNIPLSAYIGSAVMTVCAPASRPISPAAPYDFRWGMRNSYKGFRSLTTLPQRSAGRQIRPRLRSHRSELHDAGYARRWRRRGDGADVVIFHVYGHLTWLLRAIVALILAITSSRPVRVCEQLACHSSRQLHLNPGAAVPVHELHSRQSP